ncbi:uncharacterized protein LOC113493038 [Trichoplusia ni]|uniref:Uncharacterized protein LOC113493038 n=1 Tax=Trichoplusia ni TaxID=7111 RepID=A0A7E5VED9_TRINI|nr:uncharacterized protein LOC113493038 [Trichoplusia ni]
MKVYQMTISKSDRPSNLQMCLRHGLRLGRWAGFFPVQGLGQTAIDGTSFKIKCFYSIYYLATIVGQVTMSSFTLLYFFQHEVTMTTVSYIIFYVTSLVSAILLLKLAKQWPKLMKKAKETEQILTEVKLDNRAVLKSSIIAYVAMALALVEHLLCTNFNVAIVMNCLEETSINTNVMENYVVHRMPYIFYYVPYSIYSALLFEYICIQSTFMWSFNDVLTICFSVYITAYFNTLNKVIANAASKNKANVSWATLREHYSSFVKLVKEIDAQVSSFILLSFFTDLFFICLQLFNSLHRDYVNFKICDDKQTKLALTSADYLLYYLYSFLFLVLRALMLSLFAANVHCVAMEPIFSIYDVSPSAYDNEVRRFELQLHHTKVGLTGKFFYVTREMVLKVVGTIITYELVLLQYSVPPKTPLKTNTATTAIYNDTEQIAYGQILATVEHCECNKVHDKRTIKESQFVTFQKCMKVLLIWGQCIGLNPVCGITNEDASKMRFTVFSLRFIYAVTLAVFNSLIALLCIYRLSASPTNISALVEHGLSVLSKLARVSDCNPKDEFWPEFHKLTSPWYYRQFNITSDTAPMQILLQALNLSATVVWNYLNMFVVCISMFLTSILLQVNKKIVKAVDKNYMPSSIWGELREDYTRATRMVRLFDDVISPIILISFANDLFFVCGQLFNILVLGFSFVFRMGANSVTEYIQKCPNYRSGILRGYEYPIYLTYSLVFLCGRFVVLSLATSEVNTASLEPSTVLYGIPSSAYSKEVERFLHQVNGDFVGLTGLRFFNITREVILSVASTIVTYELVLLQFSSQ